MNLNASLANICNIFEKDAGAQPPWDGGVADTLETCYSHMPQYQI